MKISKFCEKIQDFCEHLVNIKKSSNYAYYFEKILHKLFR